MGVSPFSTVSDSLLLNYQYLTVSHQKLAFLTRAQPRWNLLLESLTIKKDPFQQKLLQNCQYPQLSNDHSIDPGINMNDHCV